MSHNCAKTRTPSPQSNPRLVPNLTVVIHHTGKQPWLASTRFVFLDPAWLPWRTVNGLWPHGCVCVISLLTACGCVVCVCVCGMSAPQDNTAGQSCIIFWTWKICCGYCLLFLCVHLSQAGMLQCNPWCWLYSGALVLAQSGSAIFISKRPVVMLCNLQRMGR